MAQRKAASGLEKELCGQRFAIAAGSIFDFCGGPPWPSDGLNRPPPQVMCSGSTGPKEDSRSEEPVQCGPKALPQDQGLKRYAPSHCTGSSHIRSRSKPRSEGGQFITHCCSPHLTLLPLKSCLFVPLGIWADNAYRETREAELKWLKLSKTTAPTSSQEPQVSGEINSMHISPAVSPGPELCVSNGASC